MGIVVPHITTDWRWSWIKKANMKNIVDDAATVDAVAPLAPPIAPPPTPPLGIAEQEEDPREDTIMVEIDGEIHEMGYAQAQHLLA
jgi:hypothetical protein